MLLPHAFSTRRRRVPAVLAMVLYLAVGVAAPWAHARGEVLSSRSEVEAQHTQLCTRIHTEAACQVGITFQVLSNLPRALPAGAAARSIPLGGGLETPFVRPGSSSPHPVRAPPAR